MKVLLLIGKSSTSHEAVAAEADELRRAGHEVVLGTRVPPLPVLAEAVDTVVLLDPRLPQPAAAAPAAGASSAPTTVSAPAPEAPAASVGPPTPSDPVRRVVATARRRVRRLRGQVSGAVTEPARSWRSVRRSPTLLDVAGTSDVVVAVDAPMVRAAWHLGQRLPLPAGPEVVYGLPAAASAIERRGPA